MKKIRLMHRARDERGAIAIIAAITLPILIGFAALAIDLSHLYVVRNELQNGADAGALAGARVLYNDSGTSVNENANQTAFDAAVENRGQNIPVEINWQGGNEGDVQRGHWSFATRTFTPNASLAPVKLGGVSTEELDANVDFINAVRVKTRREANPVTLFFARIFGKETARLSAEAVAYLGFTGALVEYEAELPVVICEKTIVETTGVQCKVGRMINSGQNLSTRETGGWTDFNDENPCTGGTNATLVREVIDGVPRGNRHVLQYKKPIATNGGEIQSAFNALRDLWVTTTNMEKPWYVTLPVVDCQSNNIGTCEEVLGAVRLAIVWITGPGEDPSYSDAPKSMGAVEGKDGVGSWPKVGEEYISAADGVTRWDSFVKHFNLKNFDGTTGGSLAPYAKKTIYFYPVCDYTQLTGITGGENFGLLAKVPVLVK